MAASSLHHHLPCISTTLTEPKKRFPLRIVNGTSHHSILRARISLVACATSSTSPLQGIVANTEEKCVDQGSGFFSKGRGRHVFCTFALKMQNEDNNFSMETNVLDFDDANEEENNGDVEGDEDDLPLGYMRKWYKNKPSGFGQGKMYDTSIEDRMVDELEQSRRAQFANINRLKNNPSRSRIKNSQLPAHSAPVLFSDWVHVCVSNLPKKKNVHRDLRNIFNDFSGLINIRPEVSGNMKTRDPICKGFAIVDLKSMEDAIRFIETFSNQSMTFGKIQRPIKCEMMNPTTSDSAFKPTIGRDLGSKRVPTRAGVVDQNITKKAAESVKPHGLVNEVVWEDSPKKVEPAYDVAIRKRKAVNMRVKKVPKSKTLGAAVRLKVREKSSLLGALSKYGGK